MADADTKLLSVEDSDKDGDTFEDAPDMHSRSHSQQSHLSSTSIPPSVKEGEPSSATSTPRSSRVLNINSNDMNGSVDNTSSQEVPESKEGHIPAKSPLLTAHSASNSEAHKLHVGGDATDDQAGNPSTTAGDTPQKPNSPTKLPSRMKGLSGSIPSVPWGPPPSTKPHEAKPSVTPNAKKSGIGFSWFSRKPSANIDTSTISQGKPTNLRERRNTAASVNSLASNPELMLNKLDEANDSDGSDPKKKQGDSLRDRFKLLRMREEAGIQTLEGQATDASNESGGVLAGLIGRSTSLGVGVGSPTSVADEADSEPPPATSPITSPAVRSPGVGPAPSDPNLAPGTAAGMTAGPSAMTDPAAPVDWDLWQAVVYEGPAAVARTSAEELNRAIATGIPSAIRGVVWQVLAQSKNEELEGVYKELVVRGTDKDHDLTASLQGHAPSQSLANSNLKEYKSVTSSASSMHSDHSTPATSATNGLHSPTSSQEKEGENTAKLQAAMIVERKKKAQEDKSAIHKLEKVIKRDLGARTSYSKYAAAAGLQDGLFGLCKAYALFDEGVGYAQGMNFLVMPLLFSVPEEEAFCLLVRLMNHYHLREMFIKDMPGLHLHLYQFERLLEDLEPALYCHLHRKGVQPRLYATQWFLTLFAYRFPLQLVLRIYDLILSEGLEGAILKFGIVLMQKNAETLLDMNDMAQLTNFLKDKLFDVYIDQAPTSSSILESGFFGTSGDKEIYRADTLVQDACAVKITPEMLKSYTAEWEEKQRIEKEQEAELEGLRTANATLTNKVRNLEERAEKSDTEHVQMASQLVRTKVENQELSDNVESLKGQTEELRVLVDKQTEEVEQRLKGEMETSMQRNLEVQNENRGLEEHMAEMEKVLVETKMQFAEVCDLLRQGQSFPAFAPDE
ncbi:uncharacterized protein KY384_004491 [Bacidia gigantensis]|uniref:uncharacterized protein n=1 Tax=Bacidia gigantensis TaxID=2732470 RepID=UPI001D04C45A|nr:uncharacterized protein KY384_004491 [Bacidia gigantensis]KAG8531133.1 hypothetical protein KY384_004491 [Bacidia gigantensis]